MSLLYFRQKKPDLKLPGPAPVLSSKPVDERDRDDAITGLETLNRELDNIHESEASLADRKRRVLRSIEGRKAQLDALERPERQAIATLESELDISSAISQFTAEAAE